MAVPASLQLLIGPMLMLFAIALLLYGTYLAQVYYYACKYKGDPIWLRSIVCTVFILETIHTVMCLHVLYWYFVENFGDPSSFGRIVWSAGLTGFLEVVIIFFVQGFYIYRVWQLSKGYRPVIAILFLGLLCRTSLGIVTSAYTFRYDTWQEFLNVRAVKITMNIGLSVGAIVDSMTTMTLIYYLWRTKHSGLQSTRSLVDALAFYTMNSGAATVGFSLLLVFLFDFVHTSLMFVGFVQITCQLYANSMLMMLNVRNKLKKMGLSEVNNIRTISLRFRENRSGFSTSGSRTTDEIVPDPPMNIGTLKSCSTDPTSTIPSTTEYESLEFRPNPRLPVKFLGTAGSAV